MSRKGIMPSHLLNADPQLLQFAGCRLLLRHHAFVIDNMALSGRHLLLCRSLRLLPPTFLQTSRIAQWAQLLHMVIFMVVESFCKGGSFFHSRNRTIAIVHHFSVQLPSAYISVFARDATVQLGGL